MVSSYNRGAVTSAHATPIPGAIAARCGNLRVMLRWSQSLRRFAGAADQAL